MKVPKYELSDNDRRVMTALADCGYELEGTYTDCVWMVRHKKNYIPRYARISARHIDLYSDEGNYFITSIPSHATMTAIKAMATAKYRETHKGTSKAEVKGVYRRVG